MSLFLISLLNLFTVSRSIDKSYCDIKGNVEKPGVYLVNDGDVIYDIILKAGGLKKNSYVKNINLSKKVTNEMVIYIMSIKEYEETTKPCPICKCEISKCSKEPTTTITNKISENTTTLKTTSTKITNETTSKKFTTNITNFKININTATIEELENLPGVGKTIAKNIVDYRESTLFETIEDILKVKGIGNVLFNKIKEYITV